MKEMGRREEHCCSSLVMGGRGQGRQRVWGIQSYTELRGDESGLQLQPGPQVGTKPQKRHKDQPGLPNPCFAGL